MENLFILQLKNFLFIRDAIGGTLVPIFQGVVVKEIYRSDDYEIPTQYSIDLF